MNKMTAYGKSLGENSAFVEEIRRQVREKKQQRAQQLAAVRARRRAFYQQWRANLVK